MRFLEAHKSILAVAIILIGIGALVFFFVLRPRIQRNERLRLDVESIEHNLKLQAESDWRLDPGYLHNLRQQYEKNRDEMLNNLVDVLRNSNREFQPLIDPYENGQSFKDWSAGIQLFDYQEYYGKALNRLRRAQVFLDDSYLGIKEDSVPPRGSPGLTYRLLVKIYLVERVAMLCRKHNLDLNALVEQTDETPGRVIPGRSAAMIKVLPVRVYSIGEDALPFLEEYPIRIRVRGDIGNLSNFLRELTDSDRFLPLETITVQSIGVENFEKFGYDYRRHEAIEADLVCSGFLVTEDIEQLLKERASQETKRVNTWTGGI